MERDPLSIPAAGGITWPAVLVNNQDNPASQPTSPPSSPPKAAAVAGPQTSSSSSSSHLALSPSIPSVCIIYPCLHHPILTSAMRLLPRISHHRDHQVCRVVQPPSSCMKCLHNMIMHLHSFNKRFKIFSLCAYISPSTLCPPGDDSSSRGKTEKITVELNTAAFQTRWDTCASYLPTDLKYVGKYKMEELVRRIDWKTNKMLDQYTVGSELLALFIPFVEQMIL